MSSAISSFTSALSAQTATHRLSPTSVGDGPPVNELPISLPSFATDHNRAQKRYQSLLSQLDLHQTHSETSKKVLLHDQFKILGFVNAQQLCRCVVFVGCFLLFVDCGLVAVFGFFEMKKERALFNCFCTELGYLVGRANDEKALFQLHVLQEQYQVFKQKKKRQQQQQQSFHPITFQGVSLWLNDYFLYFL